MSPVVASREASARFACFGGECGVLVTGPPADARRAVADARAQMLAWHAGFTRFEDSSELSRLNADPRTTVPVSAEMTRFVATAVDAARMTDGLVDPTLLGAIEDVGYRSDLGTPVPLRLALGLASARRPAQPHPDRRWRQIEVDAQTVTRPPGVRIDSGGIAKGVLADLLAERFAAFEAFAFDCAGDLRVGGGPRLVNVESPFDQTILHAFELADAGVATSGIGRRSWLGADGRPAHHLLDPSSGRPAYTGIVQATAIAPTATLAEARSKAALLSGPDRARHWLPDGGLLVFDDASHAVV